MKWLRALGGMLVVTLLFTACLKVDAEVVIDDDGSGNVDFLSAVDAEAITELMGVGASEICDSFGADITDTTGLPAGARVEAYNEGDFCGGRVLYDLPPANDHSANMSELFDEQTSLFKEGDNWFFESEFSAEDITAEADDFGQDMVENLFGEASFDVTIDLPGRAVEGATNADRIGNDGRFTWNINLLDPPQRLFAQTEPGSGGGDGSDVGDDGGGGGLLRILLGLLILGAIAAGVWWFLKNRGGGDDAAASVDPLTGEPLAPNPLTPNPLAPSPLDPGGSLQPMNPMNPTGPPTAAEAFPSTGLPSSGLPSSDAVKETVVMNTADAQRLAAEARGIGTDASSAVGGAVSGAAGGLSDAATGAGDAASEAVSGATGAASDATPEPIYDDALGAWVIDHPTRGRLRHDPATDTWNPA